MELVEPSSAYDMMQCPQMENISRLASGEEGEFTWQSMIAKRMFSVLAAVGLALATVTANAVPFYWTDWTGVDQAAGAAFQAQGTITTPTSTVTVTYLNPQGVGFYQPSGGTDYYSGGSGATSPYTSSLVDNRPTGTDIIALQFAGTQTLQFSQAIANPVFAFVSLNRNGYAFDQDFDILSLGGVDGNACGYWSCGGAEKKVVVLNGQTRIPAHRQQCGWHRAARHAAFHGRIQHRDLAQPHRRVLEWFHRRCAGYGH